MRLPLTILAIAAAFLAALPLEAGARPLRVWVMNNEAAVGSADPSEAEVRAAVEEWRANGIMIENTPANLMMPAETIYPLAAHVLGDNNFLRQISDYREETGDAEPISIEFIRWDDAYSRIVSGLMSDDIENIPDIAQVGHSWAVGLTNNGRLAELSAFIDGASFYPQQMVGSAAFEKEGLYAVPWFSEMRLLYYDRSAVPSTEGIADWDSFLHECKSYTKRTGKHFIGFPTIIGWNLLHNIAPWLWAGGGDVVQAANIGPFAIPQVALDSEESLSGMLFLKKLSEAGCASFPGVSQETVDRVFLEGGQAAIITGPWITRLMGPGWRRRYGVAPLPDGPAGSQPFVGGSHLIVSEASRARGNFDRAAAFVRFLTSPGAQRTFNRMSGFYPVNRDALESFLESDTEGLLKKAVERGLSYPAIGDWGEIVENEFIRSHLWHIWRDIAQGVPDETLIATVQNAASNLRRKLYLSQARRAAPFAAAGIAALLAAAAATTAWSRRRMRDSARLCEARSADLARIFAERTVLEGKALLLERRGEQQTEELARLRTELAALSERASVLKAELARSAPRKPGDEKRIGSFSIGWDGTLAICGERVRFDNNRQARRLLEQLVRAAHGGRDDLHCLWGYALFGWKAGEIQSHPQRLFEIMAAKINAQLKSHGAPAIVLKAGKGTFTWRLGWDKRLVLESSDMARSASESELAFRSLADNSVEPACAHAITALELDPKNMEALAALKEILRSGTPGQPYASRMESMQKISQGIIAREIEAQDGGIRSLERIASSGKFPKGIDPDRVESELADMRGARDYLSSRFAAIFAPADGEKRSAVLGEILHRLSAIQGEIASLKRCGASDEGLWAQVAGSRSFSHLMAVPHISSLVGNFYNEEMQSKEDPRLVQLALISMLSQEGALSGLDSAKDERDAIAAMRKALTREIDSLSDSISTMS